MSLWLIYIINQHNNIIAANEFDLTNNYAQLGFPKYQENNVDYFKQLQVIQKTSDQLKIPFLKNPEAWEPGSPPPEVVASSSFIQF